MRPASSKSEVRHPKQAQSPNVRNRVLRRRMGDFGIGIDFEFRGSEFVLPAPKSCLQAGGTVYSPSRRVSVGVSFSPRHATFPGMTTAASSPPNTPVLILGAGVNGACIARELVLNGVPVLMVDLRDLAFGATAKSSRLIHGGLRYLEYGEFRLVRESLEERRRLLALAPHLVRPLRLHIPLRRRRGGLLHAACRFLGIGRVRWVQQLLAALRIPAERGAWAARVGLTLYDTIAGRGDLPAHDVARLPAPGRPPFDPARYLWDCSYWDAQMPAPERFVIALLHDAVRAARETGSEFELLTYHRARLEGDEVVIEPVAGAARGATARRVRPAMIVNATGAWGDATLAGLPIPAPRLFGGTRGSHLVTRHPELRAALQDDAVYAEAPDGRLVFILPWLDTVLIGTTDERFLGDPAEAITTEAEMEYLVGMVRFVFPQIELTVADVDCHYSGVRPLPYVPEGKPGAITRDHAIDARTTPSGIPIDTLVGGKLTTCRAFGEQAADRVLSRLGVARRAGTRARVVPGGADYPATPEAQTARITELARQHELSIAAAGAVWQLFGTEAGAVLSAAFQPHDPARGAPEELRQAIAGTNLPVGVVDWVIEREWVQNVSDLVERRLLLVFGRSVSRATLEALEDRIRRLRGDCPCGATEAAQRLREHYGLRVD